MDECLIGIGEKELDRPIYRIMDVKYLFDLFESRENVLVTPRKWDDPFENFILDRPFLTANGQAVQVPYRDRFFGQCWSTKSQSDALWRIYSSPKIGIQLIPPRLLTAF